MEQCKRYYAHLLERPIHHNVKALQVLGTPGGDHDLHKNDVKCKVNVRALAITSTRSKGLIPVADGELSFQTALRQLCGRVQSPRLTHPLKSDSQAREQNK